MRRSIAILLAFAGMLFGASSAFASGTGYTSYTIPVPPGVIADTSTLLQSEVSCGGNQCSMIYRYRKVGTSRWTLSNRGVLVELCSATGIGLACGASGVDYAETITRLSSGWQYEYQVGLKVGAGEIAWAGPDGTSSTTTSWITN